MCFGLQTRSYSLLVRTAHLTCETTHPYSGGRGHSGEDREDACLDKGYLVSQGGKGSQLPCAPRRNGKTPCAQGECFLTWQNSQCIQETSRHSWVGSWLLTGLKEAQESGEALPASLRRVQMVFRAAGNAARCGVLGRGAAPCASSARYKSWVHQTGQPEGLRGVGVDGMNGCSVCSKALRRPLRATSALKVLENTAGCLGKALLVSCLDGMCLLPSLATGLQTTQPSSSVAVPCLSAGTALLRPRPAPRSHAYALQSVIFSLKFPRLSPRGSQTPSCSYKLGLSPSALLLSADSLIWA